MSSATRRTRACTLEALDGELRAALRTHITELGLEDIESDILMCCETITVHQKKGFQRGIRTTLSAVYVTPKWLVWADSHGPNDAAAGAVQLNQIDVGEDRSNIRYPITPAQWLNITGRHTDQPKTGVTFIALGTEADGQKFRRILAAAWRRAAS